MAASTISTLNADTLATACYRLADRESDFADVIERWGIPPLWDRAPGFLTLIHIILEQQVSLASAQAAFDRLKGLTNTVTPEFFLTLDDETLKQVGFSRQKIRYGRLLAEAIQSKELDLDQLTHQSDEKVFSTLTSLKGIGPWTANIYLLMVLCRADIWPIGDVALATAAHEAMNLPQRPSQEALLQMSYAWQPWRSAAARMLWHHYLSVRVKPSP